MKTLYFFYIWGCYEYLLHVFQIVHGDGITQIKQLLTTGLPSQVLHSEKDFEYRWDYQYSGGLLIEERIDYGPKTGLSNAKLTYQYDDNFRVVSVQGRIGGQSLPEHALQYSQKTGAKSQLGQFTVNNLTYNTFFKQIFYSFNYFMHTKHHRSWSLKSSPQSFWRSYYNVLVQSRTQIAICWRYSIQNFTSFELSIDLLLWVFYVHFNRFLMNRKGDV